MSPAKETDTTSGEDHEDSRCFSDSNTLVRALGFARREGLKLKVDSGYLPLIIYLGTVGRHQLHHSLILDIGYTRSEPKPAFIRYGSHRLCNRTTLLTPWQAFLALGVTYRDQSNTLPKRGGAMAQQG